MKSETGGEMMSIRGVNHLTFSVSDLEKSIEFYQRVFEAKLLVKGPKMAYFDLNGIWLALNVQKEISRTEIFHSYTHIAFSIEEEEFEFTHEKLKNLNVRILPGRDREEKEKRSIYFTDPDGHLFEFHTGTLQERLRYYKEVNQDMTFYT